MICVEERQLFDKTSQLTISNEGGQIVGNVLPRLVVCIRQPSLRRHLWQERILGHCKAFQCDGSHYVDTRRIRKPFLYVECDIGVCKLHETGACLS